MAKPALAATWLQREDTVKHARKVVVSFAAACSLSAIATVAHASPFLYDLNRFFWVAHPPTGTFVAFDDTFGDGNPPPNAPNFTLGGTASYSVLGSFNYLGGPAEADGRLRFDGNYAPLVANSLGTNFVQRIGLNSNVDSNAFGGLRKANTFDVFADFDLLGGSSTGIVYRRIGLDDLFGGPFSNDHLVTVRIRTQDGANPTIEFYRANFSAVQEAVLDSDALLAPAGATQIRLGLHHVGGSLDVTGSYAYLNAAGDILGATTTLAGSAPLFSASPDDIFARTSVAVFSPVSEPPVLGLLVAALFGSALMRRARNRR
jgi:hypothetical protein